MKMIRKIKKKLLHFYTNGSIAEDFVASRRAKIAKIRGITRLCFYLHCAAALLCIGLSYLLGAGYSVIYVTVCALISAWFSMFAAGDLMVVKIISCVLDAAFAVLGFVAGAYFEPRGAFFACGGIMAAMVFAALAVIISGAAREFLEEFSPIQIRREDYTLLSEGVPDAGETAEKEEEIPPLPPLTSEMRELSKQLRDILCTEQEKDAFSKKNSG